MSASVRLWSSTSPSMRSQPLRKILQPWEKALEHKLEKERRIYRHRDRATSCVWNNSFVFNDGISITHTKRLSPKISIRCDGMRNVGFMVDTSKRPAKSC